MPERYLGRQLGRFRVDALIGTGGFAWVYRGFDPDLETQVAIKVLKPQYGLDEEFEARFRQEASLAARLRHPNIIHIFEVGREGDAVYLVMDYLATELTSMLGDAGTLPEPLIVAMGMDVAAALAFAHRERVIHRDIKTDNILFDEHGNAIVADFGIARAVSSYVETTGSDMLVGTPQYLSPEQARNMTLDGRSDLYSLGVTLFRAATGVLPFPSTDWYELLKHHVETPPPAPRSINPEISAEFERIILKCLEKEPADRYRSADALREDLGPLIGRATTPGSRPSLGTAAGVDSGAITTVLRRLTPSGRGPRRVTLTLAVVALLGAALVLGEALLVRFGGPGWEAATESTPAATGAAPAPAAELPPIVVNAPGAESAGPAAPSLARVLVVDVPKDATVTVDSVAVGTGPWRSDSIAAGAHLVVARVRAVAGCASARREARITVGDTGTVTARLTPRPCGYLAIDATPAAARYTVTDSVRKVVAKGTLRPRRVLLLPTGRYVLRVSASYCADFTAPVLLTGGATRRERVRLICR